MMHRVFVAIMIMFIWMIGSVAQAQQQTLSIIWHDSEECTLLDSLTDSYPNATITVNCVSEAQWFDTILVDLAARIGADLIVMDTQFMDTATNRGHLLDLTDWANTSLAINDYPSALLDAHRTRTSELVGLPLLPDVRVIAYRADVFAASGFDVPTTWVELLIQARELKASGLIDAGFATHWSRQSDNVVSTWNHILWSYGGHLWDAETFTVEGIINDEVALDALTLANELWQTAPDDAISYTPDDLITTICDGTTAIVELWVTDASRLLDPVSCEQASAIEFATVPAGRGFHFTGYDGVGISVSAYTRKQVAALDFLAWLQSDTIQQQWMELGAFSGRLSVAEQFTNLPYGDAYLQSLPLVRDYWTLEEFDVLRSIQQQYLNLAISGQVEPQEALDAIASAEQSILDNNYSEESTLP